MGPGRKLHKVCFLSVTCKRTAMKTLIILLFLLLSCCGFRQVQIDVIPKIEYQSWTEIGYCMKESGETYNVLVGSSTSAPMPLCNRADIVMHTHPVWAERFANFWDFHVWQIYRKRYGNLLYGVSGKNWIEIYETD